MSTNAVEYASWLTRSCLCLAGDFAPAGADRDVTATLLSSEGSQSLGTCFFRGGAGQGVLAVVVPSQGLHGEKDAVLRLEWDARALQLNGEDIRTLAASPDHVVREALAPLDPATRGEVVAFLASTLAAVPEAERAEMSDRLFQLRQALRERLPDLVNALEKPLGAHVDRMMAVDESSFYVEGWMRSKAVDVVRLTAIAPEGGRVELLHRLFRCRRSDVAEFYSLDAGKSGDELGFMCFFETDAPSPRGDGWLLEVEDARGNEFELQVPPAVTDALEVRQAILGGPQLDRLPDDELMSQLVYPAITRIQSRLSLAPVTASVIEYGHLPDAPDVSIVVPLYLQIDHLEAQLAEFANDLELFESDLIYVLDSPQQAEELASRAADLHPIYQIPFRVALLERNAGFAGACNAGAALARGRLLLLLNSDVLPDRPGWLGTMRDFYDATPNIGALGPKLMYEDGSIQHAGMYYHRLAGSSLWVDGNYYKGMHRTLPAANVARRVPLVSGACLMVDRALYDRLGGLPTIYVQGDYEDADFCLQLSTEGLDNWYLPDAELYHLEGQSYAAEARRALNRYNMWLHNGLRRDQIAALMAETGSPATTDRQPVGKRQ
jgi:GT2 family glycosyltransferase